MRLRVRFAETDQMGVAHHSAFVVWLEAARVEWLRERGLSYREMEAAGVSLAVSSLSLQYLRSARFDDELIVSAFLTEAKSRRVRYRYRLTHPGGPLVATGETSHIPIDRSGRAIRLPPGWLGSIQPHLHEAEAHYSRER